MIAYIPNQKIHYSSLQHKTKFDKETKTLQLQQLYEAALKNLREVQSDGSLNNIELRLGTKCKVVNLKIPIMYIIGDNQGGNSICGRHIHYGLKAKRISRTCNAGPEQLKMPKLGSCKRIKMQDVMDNVISGKIPYLDSL